MRARINSGVVSGFLPYIVFIPVVLLVLIFGRNDLGKYQLLSILAFLYIIGGVLGEIISYAFGLGVDRIERIEHSRAYRFIIRWRWIWLSALFLGFVNALSPISIPAVSGLLAGNRRYSMPKFVIFTLLGRSVGTSVVFAVFGELALDFFCKSSIISWTLGASLCS